MPIIAIVNMKGGVGKSTTAINLAAGLAYRSRYFHPEKPDKVLLIDLDPLCSSLMAINFKQFEAEPKNSLYALLRQTPPPSPQRIVRCGEHHPNLEFFPSNRESMRQLIDSEFYSLTRKEDRLARAVRNIVGEYRFIIIDTPPQSGAIIDNALVLATHAIVPVETSYLGAYGLLEIEKQIKNIELNFDKKIPYLVAPTMIEERSDESKQLQETLSRRYKNRVLQAIHKATDIRDAHNYHMDIFTYRPGKQGADQIGSVSRRASREYADFVEQVITLTGD